MVAAIVGAFAFSAVGMLVAVAVKDMPTANMSLTALRLPMIFISGVLPNSLITDTFGRIAQDSLRSEVHE